MAPVLSPEQILALPRSQAAWLIVQLGARLAMEEPEVPPTPEAPDEPLDVKEAARRLGCSTTALYEHRHDPFFARLRLPTKTRRIRFSARKIAAALAAGPGPSSTIAPEGPRQRPRQAAQPVALRRT